ncbi:autoinducer binding domain-containing protein [Candidatus Odyssella acanthamoebae]|uniref:Transcription factor LuxR-like autoinducer-binding domain-containing protein n=1 Tax=Candidatus Odyssella acanthamoebae TaxID=91604 RepID=A0A077AX44_9PROT|nr:autoinducer binding domain-containing protein [Candidatus Paracaedibacter acanthamoebae]AIK96549.1 hypothetical protein ID47_07075 [Candidatus Paracaedibacter acanthamoebae]
MEKNFDLTSTDLPLDKVPSNNLIQNILQSIPYQYYTFYLNVEKDVLYDHGNYEYGIGLTIFDQKMADEELFTNYPAEWAKEYFNKEMMNSDPILLHGCHTLLPYAWGTCRGQFPSINSPSLLKLLNKSSHYGIENGISVPIGIGTKIYGIFTLTFEPSFLINTALLYQLASLIQNLGVYMISYRAPTSPKLLEGDLKPIESRQKILLNKTFNALIYQSQYIAKEFENRQKILSS